MDAHSPFQLSPGQVEDYLEHGFLVVDNVLSPQEVEEAMEGMRLSLKRRGVETFDRGDEVSARAFDALSSTNGSGGVLDIFYDDWKMKIATNPKLFTATQQLWKAGYCLGSKGDDDQTNADEEKDFKWHPYGRDVDFDRGYLYIDRVGYRLPTELSEAWGAIHAAATRKKHRSIQRSLTPHLDCCPNALYENVAKWRPIQCFISLTDTPEKNQGGFECVPGFHRTFATWAKNRPATILLQKDKESGEQVAVKVKPACVGEYSHIRPKEDASVMVRVRHVPVKAGSAVFWDNRIPHGNSYRNDRSIARAVVYCSFLPDIELNRQYVRDQLVAWKNHRPIRDQWNNILENDECVKDKYEASFDDKSLTELGLQLMGIAQW